MDTTTKILIYLARILGLAWAGFWLFFGFASSLGEGLTLTGIIMHMIVPGVIFLGIALLAWRWPQHGIVVLVAIGLVAAAGYPIVMSSFAFTTILFVELTMALPPLVTALLFFCALRRERAIITRQPPAEPR